MRHRTPRSPCTVSARPADPVTGALADALITQEHITSTLCNLGSAVLEASGKLGDSEMKSFWQRACCVSLL